MVEIRAPQDPRRGRRRPPKSFAAKARPGQTVVFDEPVRFKDGRMFGRLDVAAYSASRRTVIFRDPGFDGLDDIPNLKARAYQL